MDVNGYLKEKKTRKKGVVEEAHLLKFFTKVMSIYYSPTFN